MCRRPPTTFRKGSAGTPIFIGLALALVVSGAVVYRSMHSSVPSQPTAARVQAEPTDVPLPMSSVTTSSASADTPTWPKPVFVPPGSASVAGAGLAPGAAPSPVSDAPPQPAPQRPRPVPTPSVNVVVYTTSWCPHCREAKAWMASRGIPYEERNIEASMSNERMMKEINARGGVPTFDVEGEVMVGFSEDSLSSLLRRVAARRAARSF